MSAIRRLLFETESGSSRNESRFSIFTGVVERPWAGGGVSRMSGVEQIPTVGPIARYEQQVVQRIQDFNDPRQEWRRLFSEVLGTFFLVLVAAGGGMMGHAFPGTISRTAAVGAPALMVMAVILFMGT